MLEFECNPLVRGLLEDRIDLKIDREAMSIGNSIFTHFTHGDLATQVGAFGVGQAWLFVDAIAGRLADELGMMAERQNGGARLVRRER